MLEENNTNKNDGQDGNGQGEVQPERSEKRINDLTGKLKEQENTFNVQLEEKDKARLEAEKKAKDLEFKLGLAQQSVKFPQATQYEKEIRTYTDKGLTIEEATKLVLVNKNQFQTGQQAAQENENANSFGGSAATVSVSGEKDPATMSQPERLAALEQLEKEGRFGLKDGAIFTS